MKKKKKIHAHHLLLILSICFLLIGILLAALTLFPFFVNSNSGPASFSGFVLLFLGFSSLIALGMGIFGICSIRYPRWIWLDLLLGSVFLILFFILLFRSIASVFSEGFESMYLVMALFSPWCILNVLYLKICMHLQKKAQKASQKS